MLFTDQGSAYSAQQREAASRSRKARPPTLFQSAARVANSEARGGVRPGLLVGLAFRDRTREIRVNLAGKSGGYQGMIDMTSIWTTHLEVIK